MTCKNSLDFGGDTESRYLGLQLPRRRSAHSEYLFFCKLLAENYMHSEIRAPLIQQRYFNT